MHRLAAAAAFLAAALPAAAQNCDRYAVDGILPGFGPKEVRRALGAKPDGRMGGDGVPGVSRIEVYTREGARLELFYRVDGSVVGVLLQGEGNGFDPVRTGIRLLRRIGPPTLGRVDPTAGFGEAPAVWLDRPCGVVLVARRQGREWWAPGPPGTLLHVRSLDQTWAEDARLAGMLERADGGERTGAEIRASTPGNGTAAPPAAADSPSVSGAPFVAGAGGVTVPQRLSEFYVAPDYPPLAYRMKVEARVVLELVVRRDGTVHDVRVLEDSGTRYGFEDAAMAAARKWRYRPAVLGGAPVDAIVTAVVDFRR